jgi:hypothetical protein
MKRAWFVPVAALALIAGMVPAIGGPVILGGQVTQHRVSDLTSEITWNTNLYNAELDAKRSGKMIFWVHMLGDMTGAT